MRSSQWIFLIAVIVLVSCMAFPTAAMADMEGRMPFAHIQYDSTGIDNSGPIKIDVFQDKDGVHDLKIFSFGALHTMTKDQLRVINGYMFNAVGASYSMGYPNIGGKTVYVLLYQVFSSGAQAVAMVVIRQHADAKVIIVKSQ